MTRLKIQFWIKYRGFVDVYVITHQGWTADEIAGRAVALALAQFNKKWFAARRGELVCSGLTDGKRTVANKDVW